MRWDRKSIYLPVFDGQRCNECGFCCSVCPNEPDFLIARARHSRQQGADFGVPENAEAWLGYDAEPAGRMGGASGGLLTAILSGLLEAGEIDGVIGPTPVQAPVGAPHVECAIHSVRSSLDMARSSHYHPLNYAEVLRRIANEKGKKFALLGVPCIVRAIPRLPEIFREKITFVFCLVCSHNASGRFTDCLAVREGVAPEKPFLCDLRQKNSQMPDAGNFFNRFVQGAINVSRNRFATDFTVLWRNHFFALEACLYCPDFYGAEADCSVKDPWGIRSDPKGWSLCLIRNPVLMKLVRRLADQGRVVIDPCSVEDFKKSQNVTASYKALGAISRMPVNPALLAKLETRTLFRFRKKLRMLNEQERSALKYRVIIQKTNEFYDCRQADIPIGTILSEGQRLADQSGKTSIILQSCRTICLIPLRLPDKILRLLKRKLSVHFKKRNDSSGHSI